jgi:tetratricopeptide (TPR) repeat protein
MRAVLAYTTIMFVLGIGVAPATAETELLVLPPVGKDAKDVKAVLAKTSFALSGKPIDANCAGDPGCLTKIGADSNARRVLSINANGTKLTLLLVDAGAKLLLATRDVNMPKKKLAKDLGPTLGKFVEDAIVDKAKALFAEGNEHYNLGEFAPALERYKLAYRVKPLAAFQFNIAQCHRKLGQYQDAIAMYQAYLVGTPNAQNKATIESLIAEARKLLQDEQQAKAQRDRDKLATERTKAEEARKAQEAQAAAEAEQAKTEQARIAAERELEAKYDRHPARTWMILTGLVGLGAGGAGVYFATQTKDLQTKFNDLGCDDYPMTSLTAQENALCDDYRERGKRDALLTNVLIGGGGAIFLTSLIVMIVDPGNVEKPSAAGASLSVSPTSFKVVVRW